MPVNRRTVTAGLVLAGLAAAGSAAAANKVTEIAYGKHHDQRLDVYGRPGLNSAPVLIYVHGGAWTRGDKRKVNDLPEFAERNGLLLLSVGYRLYPAARADGQADDVAAAVAWARSNAASYGGDPQRLYLIGHSAGAHLVVLTGVDPTYLAKQAMAPKDLAGIIALDGAGYDAEQEIGFFDKRGGPVAQSFHEAFSPDPRALSPTLLVKPGMAAPPFLIFYITSRADSPIQARTLAAAIRNAGGKVAIRAVDGETHAEINQSFGKDGDAEGVMAAAFIKTGAMPENLIEGVRRPGRRG